MQPRKEPSTLAAIITSPNDAVRNRSLDAFCRSASLPELMAESTALDLLRRKSENLYERVRASFFLYRDTSLPYTTEVWCTNSGPDTLRRLLPSIAAPF